MKSLFNFLNCVFVRLIVNWISKTVHDCDADFVILLSNYKTRDVYQKYIFEYILLLSWNMLNLNHCLILVFYYFYWLLYQHDINSFVCELLVCDIWMVIYEFVIFPSCLFAWDYVWNTVWFRTWTVRYWKFTDLWLNLSRIRQIGSSKFFLRL